MSKDEREEAIRELISRDISDRIEFVLTIAAKAGSECASRMILAGALNSQSVAQLITDVWLDGYLTGQEFQDQINAPIKT